MSKPLFITTLVALVCAMVALGMLCFYRNAAPDQSIWVMLQNTWWLGLIALIASVITLLSVMKLRN